MLFSLHAPSLTSVTSRAAFRLLLQGIMSLIKSDMLGGDSLSSSEVCVVSFSTIGAMAVLCFLSSTAVSLLLLSKAPIGAIKDVEGSGHFDGPPADSFLSRNFAIWMLDVFSMKSYRCRSNIIFSTTLYSTKRTPLWTLWNFLRICHRVLLLLSPTSPLILITSQRTSHFLQWRFHFPRSGFP